MADDTTAPAPAPHVDFTKPPAAPGENRTAPAPTPAAVPTMVTLTVDEYQRFRSTEQQFNEFKQQQQAALEAKEQERIRALADKGQTEEALKAHRQLFEAKQLEAESRYAALEQRVFDRERSSVIGEVLAGRTIAGETPEVREGRAKILRMLLQEQVEVSRDASGEIVVRDRASGRPAADVLRERLSDDQSLAIFFAPNTRGGSGTDGTRAPAAKDNGQHAPGSLEAIAARFKAQQGKYPPMGLGPVG